MSESIRSIVVAGSGPECWITAAGLMRALRHRQLTVTVVDTGPARDARIGRWTLPSQRAFHGLLGIPEPHFLQHTGATFKIASEHLKWQGEGSGYLHAHGEVGREVVGIPFYRLIQRDALDGRPARLEEYSVAGSAARLGRFARPVGEGNALTASFTYGYHVAEVPYTRYLREHAARLGVGQAPAALGAVVRAESGAIQSLRLVDGSTVGSDLYVDCSGPDARLLGSMSEREDWSESLPADRMWSGLGPAANDPPAITRTVASASGWSWRAPVADATMYGHVFSSRFQDEASARAELQEFAPGLRGEPLLARFSAGRRREFWAGNCVAIGSSAVELEPLAGADLHLAQVGLANLIELFPRDRASTIEAAEYNRVMAEYAESLRDFTLAHYLAGASRAGAFWDATRAVEPPARLAHRLDLYAANGRINLLDQEIFEEVDWAWVLIGSGKWPDAIELQTRDALAKLPAHEIAAMRAQIQQLAASMPRNVDFLRHFLSAAPREPR